MNISRFIAFALCLLMLAVSLEAAKPQAGKKPGKKAQRPATAPVDRIFGARLTDNEGYHNAPAAAETSDGIIYVAWVQYVEGVGDAVVVRGQRREGKQGLTKTTTLTPAPGQFVRPVLAAAKDELWCLWTETRENERAAIWFS